MWSCESQAAGVLHTTLKHVNLSFHQNCLVVCYDVLVILGGLVNDVL